MTVLSTIEYFNYKEKQIYMSVTVIKGVLYWLCISVTCMSAIQ